MFPREGMTFLGRNGTGHMWGVDIWNTQKVPGLIEVSYVWMEPITSRDTPGRCHMQIPVHAIPQIIKTLQQLYEEDANGMVGHLPQGSHR